jgi:hypothetical protein
VRLLVLTDLLQAIYLPPPSLRKTPFAVPPQDAVDFRAVCFCHHDVVDVGFVCSVCLSSEWGTAVVPIVSDRRDDLLLTSTCPLSLLQASTILLDVQVSFVPVHQYSSRFGRMGILYS